VIDSDAAEFGDTSIGGEVFTSDGERLGKVWDVQDVQDVQEASFKVDAPFQPDYWLPFNTVESADAERIILNVPKDELDHYKSRDPVVA